jgi:predicted nucleic acid-binding protein
MNLVVDANVVISSLIKDEILLKTKRSETEFNELFCLLKSLINIIPKEEFTDYLIPAEKICPDKDDVQYFALALKLTCAIWSNDKILKKNQDSVKIYSTSDLNTLI